MRALTSFKKLEDQLHSKFEIDNGYSDHRPIFKNFCILAFTSSSDGIEVSAVPTMDSNPRRIKNIALDITLPKDFPENRKAAILKVAHLCPVHNTLQNPPEIDIEITDC